MANNLITNPIGLDTTIYNIQKKLYDKLQPLWNVKLDGYPRCYPIQRGSENKRSIEYYKGKNEYKSLIHLEGNKFFFTAENEENQLTIDSWTTNIDLFFILNLNQCKPSLTNRGDNEVRVDVLNVLKSISNIGLNIQVITDVDKVFQGYDFTFKNDQQPYHCFRLVLNITDFTLNDTLC